MGCVTIFKEMMTEIMSAYAYMYAYAYIFIYLNGLSSCFSEVMSCAAADGVPHVSAVALFTPVNRTVATTLNMPTLQLLQLLPSTQ